MEPLFLETIRISEGRIAHLEYHQKRLERTHQAHFPHVKPPLLAPHLRNKPFAGLYRARVLYDETIQSVEYLPYTPAVIQTFTLIQSDISYSYKYADRLPLEKLKDRIDTDEVLIVQNGLITDTTVSNVAFSDGTRWFTPKTPLLEGTVRARLLQEGVLTPLDIRPSDLQHFCEMAIFNAMLGFRRLKHARITDTNGILCFYKEGYDKRE